MKIIKIGFPVLVALVIVVMIINPFQTADESTEETQNIGNENSITDPSELSPAVLLEKALNTGKIVMLTFSYDAECCPGTEELFEAYKNHIYGAAQKHETYIELVWFNVGTDNKQWAEEILTAANEYGVTHMPSFVIIDKSGKVEEIKMGFLNQTQVEAILGKAVR